MDKHDLSERDICTKFITPAIQQAGWLQHQFREEVSLTDGRVMVRGKLAARIRNPDAKGGPKRADYVLYAHPGVPIAIVEAKQARFKVGHGMQQALVYAEMLDAAFAISSNGDGFLLHDRTGLTQPVERGLQLHEFPALADLWLLYQQWKGLTEPKAVKLVEQPYYADGSGREPRYYQRVAINRVIEAVAKGQQRVLLVMATGTGKTYTAFQIIWRLWKAKAKKRILFLADRNILVDQTMVNDFRPFGAAMAKLSTSSKTIERADGSEVTLPTAIDKKRRVDPAYEIYLGLYQAITGPEERQSTSAGARTAFVDGRHDGYSGAGLRCAAGLAGTGVTGWPSARPSPRCGRRTHTGWRGNGHDVRCQRHAGRRRRTDGNAGCRVRHGARDRR